MPDDSFAFEPIGIFSCSERYPYDAPRQPDYSGIENRGIIRLKSGKGFEQALEDLSGCSHLWLVFVFDRNPLWKPKVLPPRGVHKVGVFATRSPYRPNPIGLSCVRLAGVRGLEIEVVCHDLLDGTPILDIKPYLPDADVFPEAQVAWRNETTDYTVMIAPKAEAAMFFLATNGGPSVLPAFVREQLSANPLRRVRKRIETTEKGYCIAYRTWRIDFICNEESRQVTVLGLRSGYTEAELSPGADDPYHDKSVHRLFLTHYERNQL